ncbi:MAG: hypothetical protein ABIR18_09415 [Chitinophagaceae bacterium]
MKEVNEKIQKEGFVIIDDILTTKEIDEILNAISIVDASSASFRISSELFAIRQFLKEIPTIKNLIFNQKLN